MRSLRPPMRRPRAFTLLEVCLAVFIILLMVGAAMPGLRSFTDQNEAEKGFAAFDALAQEARTRSMQERHPYEIVWEKEAILLRREGVEEPVDMLVFGKKEPLPSLRLPAALQAKPEWIWTFWPGGLCEPAEVTLAAGGDSWSAVYDPFTARASVTYGEARPN